MKAIRATLTPAQALPAVTHDGDYSRHLERLRRRAASGVYLIVDERSSAVLYVGESHTGRLFDTITRHFRSWRIDAKRDASGRRRGGTTYDRRDVLIAYELCPPEEAQPRQWAYIARFSPRDNVHEGSTVAAVARPATEAELDALGLPV